ncbi:MAG TPA: silent information regulator protein Sir2 [Verrucomicrobiota bacterium]|nr:silent information regulator protein Sir2 [Verrucomicrobiota bacterium]
MRPGTFSNGLCSRALITAMCAAVSLQAITAERLDRGVVGVRRADGANYISWRLLADDPPSIAFRVYGAAESGESGTLLAELRDKCDFSDPAPGNRQYYRVVPVADGRVLDSTGTTRIDQSAHGYVRIRLQGNYRAQKIGLADLDGDGRLDFIVKQPDFNTDPYQQPGYWKKSEDTYKIEAYKHDGTFLWRYDMGWAIEEGIWYSPIVAYDLDGDGKAEVFCKGGEGDPREPTGHVKSGPEFLVVLDGPTGRVKQRLPWPSRDGFEDYNYYSRNLLGIAYLDGQNPHLIVERGTYTIIKLEAYGPDLKLKWRWEASGDCACYRGQGMHGMHAADVDGDGRDEVVIGAAVIDDDGRPLWNTRFGHPDVCYVADIDPIRPGLEIFYGIEPRHNSNAVCLVEARTGRLIWGNPERTVHVHGQGMVGDIIASEPGMECYAGEAKGGTNYWLYTAAGKLIGHINLGDLSPKAVYWHEGSTKVYVVGQRMFVWPSREIGRIEGRVIGIADCIGDWREEIITALEGEIRIYTTTTSAAFRRVCLMQDRLYRNDVAVQTMGYFYPPQLGKPLR